MYTVSLISSPCKSCKISRNRSNNRASYSTNLSSSETFRGASSLSWASIDAIFSRFLAAIGLCCAALLLCYTSRSEGGKENIAMEKKARAVESGSESREPHEKNKRKRRRWRSFVENWMPFHHHFGTPIKVSKLRRGITAHGRDGEDLMFTSYTIQAKNNNNNN